MKENKDALKGKKAVKCEPVDWSSFKADKVERSDRKQSKKSDEKWSVEGVVEKKQSDKDFNEYVFKELSSGDLKDEPAKKGEPVKKGDPKKDDLKKTGLKTDEAGKDKAVKEAAGAADEPVKKERKRKSLNTKLSEIGSSNWVSTGNFRHEEKLSDETIKELENNIIETTKASQDEVLSNAVDEVNKALRDEDGYEPLGEVSLGDTFEIPELDIHFGDTEELKGIDKISKDLKDKDLKKEIDKLDLAQSIEAQTAREIAEQDEAERLNKEISKKKRKNGKSSAKKNRTDDPEELKESRRRRPEEEGTGKRRKAKSKDAADDIPEDAEVRKSRRAEDGRSGKTERRRSKTAEEDRPEKDEVRRSKKTGSRSAKNESDTRTKRRKTSRDEDKVIIQSDELKERRKKKKSSSTGTTTQKKKKRPVEAEAGRPVRRSGTSSGGKSEKLSDKIDEISEFRKKSADWKDLETVEKAAELTLFKQKKEALQNRIRKMTPVQWSIAAMALIIFVTGIMTSAVYANYQGEQNKAKALASLTRYTESDSYAAATQEVTEEMLPNAAEEAEPAKAKVLSLEMSSVEKDLKIKLVDEDDTLVKDVSWSVTVTKESEDGTDQGEGEVYEDDDRDGTIYINDIAAGEYAVSLNPSDSLAEYILPQDKQLVSVKATIEYKVIANIRDEIKSEKEVNVALEDPNGNQAADVETGTAIADTVEWCESTRTENGEEYVEATPDISKTAASMKKGGMFAALERIGLTGRSNVSGKSVLGFSIPAGYKVATAETVSDDTISDEPLEEDPDPTPTPTPNPSSDTLELSISGDKTVAIGSTIELKAVFKPDDMTIEWEIDDIGIARMESSGSTCRITGVETGTLTVTAVGRKDDRSVSTSTNITIKKASDSDPSISISGSNSVIVGSNAILTATTTPSGQTISWTSSDEAIVSIISTEDGGKKCTVKGMKTGSATITASGSNGKSTTMTMTVKEADTNYSDDAKLYDASKNLLYVKDGDNYRPATYGDYKGGIYSVYYRKQDSYLYTGWQNIDGKTYYYTSDHNYVTGEQVIQGIKYNFGSDGALATGSGTLGIDVSKYQPNINWAAVKASGVNYVIIRCGYRGASTGVLIQDPYFTSHIKGAKAAGLKVGVYFFTTALTEAEAVEEASMCAELCSGYGINYPIFMDCENSSRPGYNSMSASERTTIIKAFCNTIKSAGYTPGVYANKTWLSSYINTSALSGCKIWLAQYNAGGPTYSGHYDLWQYTSKGHVDGISGNVDMNQSYLGY